MGGGGFITMLSAMVLLRISFVSIMCWCRVISCGYLSLVSWLQFVNDEWELGLNF